MQILHHIVAIVFGTLILASAGPPAAVARERREEQAPVLPGRPAGVVSPKHQEREGAAKPH